MIRINKISGVIFLITLGSLIYLWVPKGILRFYLPDFIWAVAFSISLNLISTDKTFVIKHFIVSSSVGVIYELGQKYDLWYGTYDILDILAYLIGAIIGQILYAKKTMKVKENPPI